MKFGYLAPDIVPEAYDYYASRGGAGQGKIYITDTATYTIEMTVDELCKTFKNSKLINQ